MRKTLWTLIMGVMLIFVSCQNEDDFSAPPQLQNGKIQASHFYGVKQVKDRPETRGVGQLDKLWHNEATITVKFLNDPYNMAAKIEEWAAEWEQYANIDFEFVTSGNANVRIGFDRDDCRWVTWSYTGTDCKYIRNQNEATLNFAFWDSANESEKRADVLRAFGQVLGLELEHRHLEFDPGWTSRIQQYWEGELEDIPWDELKEYVFDPIESRNLVQTDEYDAGSIMIWPFDRRYATNTARYYNYELSDMDKEFIAQLYPGRVVDNWAFSLKINTDNYLHKTTGLSFDTDFMFISSLSDTASFILDYNDGTQEIYSPNTILRHIQKDNLYSIDVYGNPKQITELYIGNAFLESADLSACTELEYLEVVGMGNITKAPSKLDLSHNTKLKTLKIGRGACGYISELNLSKNTELETLSLFFCTEMYHLDLSACTNLRYIFLNASNKTFGFMEDERLAIEFANNLPVVPDGEAMISYESSNSRFDPDWIRDICTSKGWALY